MANIRLDNFSGDTVTVILDGREETVADEQRVTFDMLEKGRHILHIHRTRIPIESTDKNKTEETKMPFASSEKNLHTQLDLIAEVDLNSSKAVVTVKNYVTAKESKGIDTIFSSYALDGTGVKIEEERKVFANSAVEKNFKSHHISNAFLPVGAGGIVIFLLGLFALVMHLSGNTINLGGTEFTLPWSLGLTAVGTAVLIYTAVCVANILTAVRKYKR